MKQYILITVDWKGAFCIKNVIEGKGELFKNILYSSDSIYFDEVLAYGYRDAIKYIKDKEIVYEYEGPERFKFKSYESIIELITGSIFRCKQAEKLREFLGENNIKEDVNYIEKLLRTY